MKRRNSVLLSLLFLILILLPIRTSVFAESRHLGQTKTITTSYFNIENLPQNILDMYKNNGWIVEKDYSYRITTPQKGDIWVDGKIVSLNKDGSFYVDPSKDYIEVSLQKNGNTQRIYKSANGFFEVTQVVNLEALMDRMDLAQKMKNIFSQNINHRNYDNLYIPLYDAEIGDYPDKPHKGYYDKYEYGDWVHCNRFNGPATDDIHYPKTDPRAYINFAGSDCDIALANSTKCWGHSYCNQTGPAGGCSLIILRSPRYHRN